MPSTRHGGDFARAIADLSRACELAPLEPEYFYQRGRLYGENRQGPLALADFSRAIELKPDHISHAWPAQVCCCRDCKAPASAR